MCESTTSSVMMLLTALFMMVDRSCFFLQTQIVLQLGLLQAVYHKSDPQFVH